ncbi:MAG: two-component sensor histidine kinase [Betaproteobacteria bacterium]|nr:two-component sensor histidine kinase [Betaproteobacteria bacterium]
MSSRVPHRIEEPASPESGSRGVGMAVVPNLRETLMPFADSVPWPVVVVDEAGLVLHVNDAMRAAGKPVPEKGRRELSHLFPEYFAAMRGAPAPWLVQQEFVVTRSVAPSLEIHEHVWVRRLPKGSCLIVVDETRLHHLESAHAQTARLASLGFMLASVSHEIGNPLTAMHTMLQVLQSKKNIPREDLERGIRNVASNVRRIVAITRKLNAFARASTESAALFAIDTAIEEAAVLLGYDSLGESVQLIHEPCADAWTFGHVDQLQQVFHNIFLNAAQAMHGSGTISVRSRVLERSVEIAVRDAGPGLPEDAKSRIFDPFFTTKPSGEGTGLGLAISYEIVHEHQGSLVAANHPDGGAVFTIALPRHAGRLA